MPHGCISHELSHNLFYVAPFLSLVIFFLWLMEYTFHCLFKFSSISFCFHTILCMRVDTQSSILQPILCQAQSVSKVLAKSLALLVANYVVQEVVFHSTIIIPGSAYQQPLLLLVLVARRGEAMLATSPPLWMRQLPLLLLNTSQQIALSMIQTRPIMQRRQRLRY